MARPHHFGNNHNVTTKGVRASTPFPATFTKNWRSAQRQQQQQQLSQRIGLMVRARAQTYAF
jgi:hypothetical protein